MTTMAKGLRSPPGLSANLTTQLRRIHRQPGDQQTHGQKQQMRWSPRGAHLLLQIRTRILNDTLTNDYRRWYPNFTHTPDRQHQAA